MGVPLADIKAACRAVLERERRPLHYADLTRRALEDLGLQVVGYELRKIQEDIREKVLLAGSSGLAYTARPHCFGVIREWFSHRPLLVVDDAYVDITTDLAVEAGVQTALRFPYILNKYGSEPVDHARRIARGFVLEVTVSRWFRQKWPHLWRQPDNAGLYRQACGHDFKLEMPLSGMVEVDVAGPNRDNEFGSVLGKPGARLHVLAEDDGLTVRIRGVMPGREFSRRRFTSEASWPITRLMVWINCECAGVSFDEIARAVGMRSKTA